MLRLDEGLPRQRPGLCYVERVSFVDVLNRLPIHDLLGLANGGATEPVRRSLGRVDPGLEDFARLISPGAAGLLEEMAQRSQTLTRQRFGKVIRLFAPLYLSNECINNCRYCGFSRDNPILRVTLSPDDVVRETRALLAEGFRNILLVAGEHPKFVSDDYLEECVRAVTGLAPSVSLEVGPLDVASYQRMVGAGAEGLVVYQETYDRTVYDQMHTSGPKRDFDWRLGTPERAYEAGFRRLGIGPLYGLADWRYEAISVAAHAQYLLKRCWKSYVTISLPRLRPCAGEFQPLTHMTDREMVQLVCAFRLMFPDVGLVLSTRENARLRDGLIPLGITLISAGSHTEPGGYTGAGTDKLYHTEKGRIVELGASERAAAGANARATVQFAIADERSSSEVAERIRRMGYEPVWKDWDAALTQLVAENG
jgi:2-iminoacetate synthase